MAKEKAKGNRENVERFQVETKTGGSKVIEPKSAKSKSKKSEGV